MGKIEVIKKPFERNQKGTFASFCLVFILFFITSSC